MQQNRIIGLDLFRIALAFLVFLFHSHFLMIGGGYGFLTPFISMGAVAMSGFFMLSGFVLFCSYNSKAFTNINEIKFYYIKRIASIYPNYIFTSLLFIALFSSSTLKQELVLAPISLLGIQTVFTSLFNFSHNGGTWFISCLLISYFFFPYILNLTKQLTLKEKSVLIVLFSLIIMYSSKLVVFFEIASIYSNPFFRFLEFFIGVILASFSRDILMKKWLSYFFYKKLFPFFLLIIMMISITVAVKKNFHVNDYMYYSIFVLPIFILMIPALAIENFVIFNNKLVNYLSNISYAFFLGQFFCFPIVKRIEYIHNDNFYIFIVSFVICFLYSVFLYHFIQKPCKKLIINFFTVNNH